MIPNSQLRPFVRLDAKGRATSQLVWRKSKPKIGRWMEIDKGECCYQTTTTTTTTTSTTTTTTTTTP